MNEEAILLLYNDLKESYDVGSIDDFKNYLMDDNKKQMFFEEVIKPTYNVDDIETFNEVYGLKKKEESTFVAPKKDVELVTEDTSLDTQETPETTEYQPQNILEPIESEDAEFEASLKTSVTPDQIKNPEEFVVPEMQYKFGKYGFDFEESTTNVLGTDAMRVKVRGTNKDLYVNLDRLWGKKGTSKELEKFLRENKRKESEILKQSQAIVQNQRTIQTDEELNASIKLFNKESERFVYEANEYAKSKAKLDSIYDSNFSNVSKELIKNNPVLKANYDEWLKESKQLDAKLKEIKGKSKDFKYKGTKLDKIAGDYTAMKAEQGTWWSGFWNEIAGGSGPTFTPISSLIDLGTYLDEKMIMGDDTDASVPVKTRKEVYKKDIIRIAKEKGLAPEGLNEDMSLDEVVKALGGDTNDVKLFFDSIVTKGFLNTPSMARARAMKTGSTKGGTQEKEETNFDIVQDKLLDIERKTKKYYEPKVDPSDPEGKRLISARERAFTDAMSDDPKFRNPFSVVGAQKDNFGNEGMVSAGRDSFNFLKDKSTTEQWAEVQKQGNFLKKGFLGLGGSLPAMLGTSTPVGWAQRTAQMYNMSTDYVDQEMEKNPMFDKISEAEKTLVKMPIGVATAVLENIGLRNIISQKGLLNSLVSKALRKSNKNTTAKTFQEFIRQDIESMIGRGALVITGAGLAEFETGLAQEISTIGIKDVYNASKESKMFETPETFATYMSQVVEAGLAEMVGGFVMGSIPAVSAAVKGLQVQNLDPKVFEIFENTIQEPTLKSAYISGLKNRIADPSNELDAKEAQEELDLVNKLEGIMIANRIPFDEFNTNQRKEALQLLMQKETLDNQIEGADKVLSKPKQELLDRVNKRLEELTGESIATQEESETEAEGITQFDSNLEEGEKIVEEAVADIDEFRSLEQDEQIKFLDQARKELLDEAESRGKTEIQITNAQSLQRAVELFKKDQQTETDTEVEVGADMLVTPAPAPAPKAEVKVEEQEDITEFFKDELGDSISPNLSINKEGKPEKVNNLKPRIIKIAKASAKAIAKLLPKTKIVLHESKSEYFKYTGTKGRGYYDTTTDTIHIDLTNATLSTAPHEVFHAVFLNKLKTDAKARAMAIKMVESVKKTLSKNSKLYKEIDAFSKLYTGKQEQFQEEEFIAELIGLMSSQEFKNYKQLKAPAKYAIVEFLKKIAKKFGIKLGSEFGKDDQSVIDLINVLATKTVTGEEITEGDVDILNKIDKELDVEQEQGESGQVGTFTFKGRESKAPDISEDTRSFSKYTIQKDLRVYEGQNFLTNMYDFTDSGKKDIGGGIVLDLYGGKNYPALMMEKTGTKPGQVSNLAAFNSKENAEGFIKNAIEGDANLFSPHVGTKEGSWQFQQNIFAQLTEKLLDNNVITNEELIESFNSGLTSKDGKQALKTFNERNETNLTNLNDFIENPKKLVELLDIDNNYSPDLRKILNDKIAANKKVQEALGVKNKIEFAEKLEDPMNVGSKPFDLIGFIEFDNTTFETPSRPKKGDADYHPSFAWTVKAKIKAIVQPTNFYQSTEVTDSYTKFNKDEVVVSTKTDLKDSKGNSVEKLYKIALKDTRKYRTNKQGKKVIASGKAPFSGTFEDFQKARFKSSNVSSSAGSGPKIATVKSEIREGREQQDAPQSRKQKAYPLEDIGKWYGDADYKRRGGELVYMTPDEFLSKAKPLKMDEDTQENIDDLVSHIEDGRKLDPLTLYSLDKTDVRSSDGRHRAYAAKELNINSVPVVDFTNSQSRKQQDAPQSRKQADLAPNGKPSNLTPEQYKLVRTPAFKNWFGDWETDPANASKVVDENGEPLVVYHGTPDGRFLDEDGIFKSQDQIFGMGSGIGVHWFAKDITTAKSYAKDKFAFDYQNSVPKVLPAFLNIRNPFIKNGENSLWRNVQQKGKTRNLISKALESKKDGVIVDNVKDNYNNSNKTKSTDTFTVFNSNQIKLADGSNITFDPEAPSVREQKSTQQIINEGRQANFKESNIRDFLVRVLNRPAKEVDELMSLDKDFLEVVPKSFTNIKGGIKAGTKLYNRVEAYRKKLVKKNDKLKDNKKLTKTQIVDKTIEYLQKQPEYINEGDKYTIGSKKKGTQETRVRKGFSTQQARMLADYTNTAGVRPTNNMGAKIRKAMAAVRQKVKGARDLQKQKTALRNFIRQSLPKALYTEKDAIDLVNKVNDVNAGNIENLMKEVIEFVNKTNVKSLQAQIKSILNKKYSKVENGIKKPVKISDDIRKRIDFINSLILNEKSTPAQIGDALIDLQNRFNQLAAEVNQTEDTRSEMVDLELAMMYINTLQFKDTNETKVEQLDNIVQTLKEMIEDGRSQLREQIREQHLYYLQQFELGYEAITGNKIDMNDPEASDELNKMKKIFENEKAKRDTQNVIKKFLRSLKEGIDRKAFGSAEDLFSLMDRLDKLPGEMYGGNLQEMFTERVDEASRLFKGRMMLVEQLIQEHLKEVYGKNWKKQSRQNRLAKDTGIMIQDGLPLSPKSQNQIAYLYNLYKDPANKKSFANPEMYGIKTIPKDATKAEKEAIQAINEQNAERIMNEMTALLDPKVKETADWQVNELYPFLYNHYNDAYKKLYRTDLPWNEFYSGTIYREGVDQEEASILDLQNSGNIYSTAVGASGTKVRENSNKAIQTMDMMDVLNTYLNQMEYFSAYGEVVRDMSKLFNNKYISDAITKIHGKDVYKYTLAIIDKIASRGTSTSFGNTFINAMNNVFILSRLAISPVIMIKQLTSFITYANDIGPLNYLKYAAKNKVQMMSVYKEIRDNSVYMKDRQSQSIMRAIETYSDANMRKFVPAGAKDWIVNFAMWTTKFGDKSAIYIGGMPNYSYYKAQFKKKNPEATEQEAIDHAVRLFERDTKRTQQSGDLQDKDYYQTKDPLYRGLNMFLTTPKQYLRKEIVAIRNLNRKLSQWDSKAGKGTVAENLRTFFMYHVIMPVFFQYVSMGLPGILRDERDDDKLDLLRAAMIGNLNALFIVGDLFQMAGDFFTGKPWAGSNIKTVGILSIAGALTEKFAYAGKLKDPTKKSEAYQKAYLELATLTGVAAPTIAKFVENYGNIGKDGDIGKDILRLLNFSKYQIEGPGKGGRPKKIKTIQELNEEYDKKKAKEQKSITGSSNIFGPSTRRKSKSSSKIF